MAKKINYFLLMLFVIFLILCSTIMVKIWRSSAPGPAKNASGRDQGRIPVEMMPVTYGPIELKKNFSGALEAKSEFVVAAKVGGRVERLNVDISDRVERRQVVVELEHEEYLQALAQAEAELRVCRANLTQARSAAEIASRELERVTRLKQRGVASDSQFDSVQAEHLANQAAVEVAAAELLKAEALLETARIRLGYAKVSADWRDGDHDRVVSERYVDEGELVSANTPLLRIVELDPITAVVFVAERDYGRLKLGQPVLLSTDAFPDDHFSGRIERIAPIFQSTSRQARVELILENPDERLKPGMFVRGSVVVERHPEATLIPQQALVRRNDQTGVFIIQREADVVAWQEVKTGITEGDRVEIVSPPLRGQVVTLGQQLLRDGSAIVVPAESAKSPDKETLRQ